MRNTTRAALSSATMLAGLALLPSAASAQNQEPASAQAGPTAGAPTDGQPGAPVGAAAQTAAGQEDTGAIIVTARRRNESIVDVPLAISVVTSEKLDKLNITNTVQLSNFVPGLQFSDYTAGDGRNDRGRARPLIFRGINVGSGGNVTAAGGMFLDGAAVVGNEIPAGMDIGAVEVLRGPQSVYFGRSTMTGAVSYRTKAIPDDLHVSLEGVAAQRDDYRAQASISGSIIPGLLKARLTGLYEDSDGYVRNDFNPNGQKLGARSRKSISGTIEMTPADTLTLKAYVNYFRDDDGPAATAFVPAQFANCQRPGATRETFCGLIPGRSTNINYLNTNIPTAFSNVIFNSPLLKGTGFDRQVGLQRAAFNSHFLANWQISDYLKLQSITGYHVNTTITAADGIGQPVTPNIPYQGYFYSLTNKTKDFSQELRLNSDPERAFSWTVGTNYIKAYDKVQAYVAFQNQLNGVATTFLPIPQQLGTNRAKTFGFFGGGYLKLFDNKLTLSAEGRYQIDKRSQRQQNGTTFVDSIVVQKRDFKSFNPRVSIDYDVGGNRKVYASYATGTRPGGFNTLLLTYFNRNDPALNAQIAQFLNITQIPYEEEKLKIGELGFKGNFGGGKGFFDINTYYGKLSNQQVSQGALIPLLGFTVTAITNVGETKVYGVEWQGNYNFTSNLSLATTFAWNHAKRTRFLNPGGLITFGTVDLSGVESANVPEYSGSAILSYTHELSGEWNFFSNTSYVYRGKQWTDAANLSYIRGRSQVDLRLGVGNKTFTIEGFMLNVFNDRRYTAGSVSPDFGQPESAALGTNTAATSRQYSAFFGAVAPPRQIGVRLRADF